MVRSPWSDDRRCLDWSRRCSALYLNFGSYKGIPGGRWCGWKKHLTLAGSKTKIKVTCKNKILLTWNFPLGLVRGVFVYDLLFFNNFLFDSRRCIQFPGSIKTEFFGQIFLQFSSEINVPSFLERSLYSWIFFSKLFDFFLVFDINKTSFWERGCLTNKKSTFYLSPVMGLELAPSASCPAWRVAVGSLSQCSRRTLDKLYSVV